MPREILLPPVAADFEGGAIEGWLKKVGDTVEVGDLLVEVSTDKAVVEVEAEFAGTLGKILVEAGTADVEVNTPIAIMLLEGEDASALDGWSPAPDDTTEASATETAVETTVTAASSETDVVEGASRSHHRLYASPIARRIAGKAGINLEALDGTGPKGRVVLGDVEAEAARLGIDLHAPEQSTPAPVAEARPTGGVNIEPADSVRRIIAGRLTEAKRDIPHFYLSVDFRIDRLLDARVQLNELAEAGEKVSVNDFFVKACAIAMREVPGVNASWTGDGIAYFDDINIAVAVASPKGLMTPVLRNADTKRIATISSKLKDLAARARLGKLKPDEFKGGGFTVSNLGMYGIREFSAIINPPQACILAIGAGEKRPIIRDDKIVIGTMASCTLSVDHRAVDGALGAEFLQALRNYIERPAKLLT